MPLSGHKTRVGGSADRVTLWTDCPVFSIQSWPFLLLEGELGEKQIPSMLNMRVHGHVNLIFERDDEYKTSLGYKK